MTTKEMYEMRMSGVPYQEIADICGMSKQGAWDKVNRYMKKNNLERNLRGHNFNIESIIYKGIYDYFKANREETILSFANKIYGDGDKGKNFAEKIRRHIKGERDAWFKVDEIKNICRVVGKPLEEVFEERTK